MSVALSDSWAAAKHLFWTSLGAFIAYGAITHLLDFESTVRWWLWLACLSIGLYFSALAIYDASRWVFWKRAVRSGRKLFACGDFEGALAAYRTCVRISPSDAICHFNVGAVLQNLDRHAEAVDAFSRSLDLDPLLEEAYRARAGSEDALGHPEAAARDVEAVERLRTAH